MAWDFNFFVPGHDYGPYHIDRFGTLKMHHRKGGSVAAVRKIHIATKFWLADPLALKKYEQKEKAMNSCA